MTAKTAAATPSGYQTHDEFFAARFRQGGRTVYSLDLSPSQIISLIPRPNPEVPVESNRQIRPKHAAEFGDYFRTHTEWVIPSVILRTPQKFDFEVLNEIGGSQFGILRIPRAAARDINILDGQHRVLGFFNATESLAVDREKARDALQRAKRQDPGGAAERDAKAKLVELDSQAKRLDTERLSVQLYVESDSTAYRQMFYDISDNALGITASVKARFDNRKVVNRALPLVLEHPLLKNRVEMELDRVSKKPEMLLAAANVAELTKNTQKGFRGRVSQIDDKTLNEKAVAATTSAFLDALTEAFPPLKSVELGQLAPGDLRKTSLLGSPAFLRILAGVWWELQQPSHRWNRAAVLDFFKKLAPHVSSDGSPVYHGSIWLDQMPEGTFIVGQTSPSGRRQDLDRVHDTMIDWALDRVEFLNQPPAPRPTPPEEEVDPEFGSGYTEFGFEIPEAQ